MFVELGVLLVADGLGQGAVVGFVGLFLDFGVPGFAAGAEGVQAPVEIAVGAGEVCFHPFKGAPAVGAGAG